MTTVARPSAPSLGIHGASHLPTVAVVDYNAELRDAEGFIGDRASNAAFRSILEELRKKLRLVGDDPLGDTESADISKKALDKLLLEGDPEAGGLIHGAIEGFATELATVIERFLKTKPWKGIERIAVGGGLRASRVGELAVGRAAVLVKGNGHAVDLVPIEHHPDHAGIVGTVHLAPSWIFKGFDRVIGVDIGGSNIRAGLVDLGSKKSTDLSDCKVTRVELWRHREEKPKRDEAIERLVAMVEDLARVAKKEGATLAPFIGIGCPGAILDTGAIEKGAQNLPGNWESSRFNLPNILREAIPKIGEHDTHVVMHNDAVVQGLSEVPRMRDVQKWGVLTIGTGLGNACFENHAEPPESDVEPPREAKGKGKKS